MNILKALSLAGVLAAPAILFAQVDFQITEIYYGLTGEDGTEDWIEVTNFGTIAGDTGTLFYDDENPTEANFGALTSFVLNPGESAVFLIDVSAGNEASEIAAFEAIWGTDIKVGRTDDGGGLSQNGDQVNLFAGALLADLIDSVTFDGSLTNSFRTLDVAADNSITGSIVGVNGAYESAMFFNDNIGDASNMVSLIGSPGVIPEPSTYAAIFGGLVLALAYLRRRR